MEPLLTRIAIALVALNTLALGWLWTTPMPPDALPAAESLSIGNTTVDPPTDSSGAQGIAALDEILAASLSAAAAERGVEPALPPDALRAEAKGEGEPDGDAAMRLLAAYEAGFAALGLSMDGLGRPDAPSRDAPDEPPEETP